MDWVAYSEQVLHGGYFLSTAVRFAAIYTTAPNYFDSRAKLYHVTLECNSITLNVQPALVLDSYNSTECLNFFVS